MSLYKDENIYRTYEEQIDHLTKAHREQLTLNTDIYNRLNTIDVSSGIGGQNLTRFAFEKQGTFYRLANKQIIIDLVGNKNDYFEIRSGDKNDIPAYGYYVSSNIIVVSYPGDFTQQYSKLILRNVTLQKELESSFVLESFPGSSLLDYDATLLPNQVFNVLSDLAYNAPTQYASFDLNRDGVFSFVYLGINPKGQDGKSIYTVNNSIISSIVNLVAVGDSVVFGEDNTTSLIDANAKIGDIYTFNGNDVWLKTGNIRGLKGDKGDKGDKGEQGIQGIPGAQGVAGKNGEKGEKGDPGDNALTIYTGTYQSASDLPPFPATNVGDAFRVQNLSNGYLTYDLYYHAMNGTTWDISPNWGGLKGDKGDKGDQGEQGIQGVQGIQGPQGIQGEKGDKGDKGEPGVNASPKYLHKLSYWLDTGNKLYVHITVTFASDNATPIRTKAQLIDILPKLNYLSYYQHQNYSSAMFDNIVFTNTIGARESYITTVGTFHFAKSETNAWKLKGNYLDGSNNVSFNYSLGYSALQENNIEDIVM